MSDAIACHYNGIPAYVGHELDRLYGTRYACMPHFRHYGDMEGVHTYVVRAGDEALTVFLFRCEGQRVRVLNEGIRVGCEEADIFADYVFNVFPSTQVIYFHFVESEPGRHERPYFRAHCAQDLVLPLPVSTQAYFEQLGASTRKTLKNRINRLKREFPSFTFCVKEREEVDEQDVRAIIGMNRARMESLDKHSSIDAEEEERIVRYVRDCGFVTMATIDGELCAGAINYRIGGHFSARILAHDARYDEQRLGFVCAYLSVCECIEHGAVANFYFGWGDNPYKFSLGAVPRRLSGLLIFRHARGSFRHLGLVLKLALASATFTIRQSILDAARRDDGSRASSMAIWLLGLVRTLKKSSV